MKEGNTILAAIRFYRSFDKLPSIACMLVLIGISGIFETLPILASLPLLRTIFLDQQSIQIAGFEFEWIEYGTILLAILVTRLFLGYFSQYKNGSIRIQLMTEFRQNSSNDRSARFEFGKRTQGLNFLFVGWSQFVPGIAFMTLGVLLMPKFGGLVLAALVLWSFLIRLLKKKQDHQHHLVSELQQQLDAEANTALIEQWGQARQRAIHWDSLNKNAREFIILSTLILSLWTAEQWGWLGKNASLISIIMLLRGMQQLYTAYHMSQQLSGLRRYFIR